MGDGEGVLAGQVPDKAVLVGRVRSGAGIVGQAARYGQVEGLDQRQVLEQRRIDFGIGLLRAERALGDARRRMAPIVRIDGVIARRIDHLVVLQEDADDRADRAGGQMEDVAGDVRFERLLQIIGVAGLVAEQEVALGVGEVAGQHARRQPRNGHAGGAGIDDLGLITGHARAGGGADAIIVDEGLAVGRRAVRRLVAGVVVEAVQYAEILEGAVDAQYAAEIVDVGAGIVVIGNKRQGDAYGRTQCIGRVGGIEFWEQLGDRQIVA